MISLAKLLSEIQIFKQKYPNGTKLIHKNNDTSKIIILQAYNYEAVKKDPDWKYGNEWDDDESRTQRLWYKIKKSPGNIDFRSEKGLDELYHRLKS